MKSVKLRYKKCWPNRKDIAENPKRTQQLLKDTNPLKRKPSNTDGGEEKINPYKRQHWNPKLEVINEESAPIMNEAKANKPWWSGFFKTKKQFKKQQV